MRCLSIAWSRALIPQPMISCGRHDEAYRYRYQNQRCKMQVSIDDIEIEKRSVEDGDQLKTEQGLDAGKHHPRFLVRAPCLVLQRLLLDAAFVRTVAPPVIAAHAAVCLPRPI